MGGGFVNTSAPPRKKLRCPDCGTKGEFPANFTQTEVRDCCQVCLFHLNHELVYDFRCAVCIARLWQARLSAIWILLFRPSLLRAEDMR
jgi:hypothetical protein